MRTAVGMLAAVLVFGMVVALAPAKPKKVKVGTGVAIEDWGYDPGTDTVTFIGRISSEKRKCLRNRQIHLVQTEKGILAGNGSSDDEGDWTISFSGDAVDPGEFVAAVDRRKYRKRRDGEVRRKIVCRRAASAGFVPSS